MTDGTAVVKPPDHWYGWVVSVCVFFVQFGVYGTMNSYSTFSHELQEDAQLGHPTSTEVSYGNALANGIAPILSIFSGAIADRVGHRFCMAVCAFLLSVASFASSYATSLPAFVAAYSIPACVASSFMSAPGAAAVSSWMQRYLPAGMGIAYSGNGAGSSVVVLLAGYLAASNLGWRVSFRYMALCPIIGLIASLFVMTRTPLRAKAFFPPDERAFIKNMLTTRVFWYLWIAAALFSYTFFSILYVIVPFGADFGRAGTPYANRPKIGIDLAVTLFTWFGAFKWGASVLLGGVAARVGTVAVYCLGALILFVACALWPTCETYAELAAVVSFLGIGVAGIFATLMSIASQYFGGPFGGLAIGIVTTSYAVGGFAGPPVTESLKVAQNGVWTWPFVVMAVAVALSGVIVGLLIRSTPPQPFEWAQADYGLLSTVPAASNDSGLHPTAVSIPSVTPANDRASLRGSQQLKNPPGTVTDDYTSPDGATAEPTAASTGFFSRMRQSLTRSSTAERQPLRKPARDSPPPQPQPKRSVAFPYDESDTSSVADPHS